MLRHYFDTLHEALSRDNDTTKTYTVQSRPQHSDYQQ